MLSVTLTPLLGRPVEEGIETRHHSHIATPQRYWDDLLKKGLRQIFRERIVFCVLLLGRPVEEGIETS